MHTSVFSLQGNDTHHNKLASISNATIIHTYVITIYYYYYMPLYSDVKCSVLC